MPTASVLRHPAGRAVIATASCDQFTQFFRDRLGDTIFVFDKGGAALDACGRLKPRYLFSDTTALCDGVSGYRIAMRLRADRPAPKISVYLFGSGESRPENRSVLDSLGVEKVLPKSPGIVAHILAEAGHAGSSRSHGQTQPQSDVARKVAACNALLHRFVGPIARKLIERADPIGAEHDGDVRGYVYRLAAEIKIPSIVEPFLEAARDTGVMVVMSRH